MKIWIDDVRPEPEGYVCCKSVNKAKKQIEESENQLKQYIDSKTDIDKPKIHSLMIRELSIELIDIDHDAGDFANDGGDFIKLLDWLEETGRSYPIRIHSMNPVGIENMRRIIQKNGWVEV